MEPNTIKVVTIIAGIGVLSSLLFTGVLIVQILRKKPYKLWLAGLVLSLIAVLVGYGLSFLGIFELYNSTAR